MLGIVCEKPSAMKHFAEALGGRKGVFEGERYVLAAMHGHLYEFAYPHEMVPKADAERYRKWSLSTLPWHADTFDFHLVPRRETMGNRRDTCADDIASLFAAEGVTEVVCATDDDPSGEGTRLFAELVEMKKLDRGRRLSRMFFADEAPASIQKAFRNRVAIPNLADDPDNKKAYFRQRWDLLGGMGLTRAATIIAGTEFTLRNGRLKSYATARVGDQLEARAAYKKVIRYQRRFRDEHDVLYTDPAQPVCDRESDVPGGFHASDVVLDSRERRRKCPPKLIDLGGLSSMLAPKGISPDTVLKTYQKMYEARVVSYPRTEDKAITAEQFAELLPLVDRIAAVVGVDRSLLTHRTPRKTHVKEGMAHGANRPGTVVPASLSGLDAAYGRGAAAIYEAVAKSYLAMLAEDFEYDRETGHVKDYPTFIGAVNVPRVAGYKAVFSATDDDDPDACTAGLGSHAEPISYEVIPPKPERPTVKWLMRQFERYDVGTGATRTSCISEITKADKKGKKPSQLMTEKKGVLDLTCCGRVNYWITRDTHIASLELTRDVFAQMDEIAAGTRDADTTLEGIVDIVADDIETMRANSRTLSDHVPDISSHVASDYESIEYVKAVIDGRAGQFKRVWSGHTFSDAEVVALKSGRTITFRAMSRAGREYDANGKLAWQTYKGKEYLGFKLDTGGVPASWCGHAFTASERAALEAGFAIAGTFKNKSGREFDCDVCFKPKKRGGDPCIIPSFAGEYPKRIEIADLSKFA